MELPYHPNEARVSVSSDMTIDKLVYQHCAIGDIGAEGVYMRF